MTISTKIREKSKTAIAAPYADLMEGAGLGVTIEVSSGRTIVIEGDPVDHYYRILSGSVRLYKAVADGRRQIIDFLGKNDCFGLTSLERHGYSAEAITDVAMVSYPRRRLSQVIEERPDLGQQLLRIACAELSQAQARMLMLGRKSAEERVASFLLDLAERQHNGSGEDVHLYLDMSRQDIADHLGLTIETVSRILTRFKAAQLIGLPDRHGILLKGLDRLLRIANGG